jgi:hypothetical protein
MNGSSMTDTKFRGRSQRADEKKDQPHILTAYPTPYAARSIGFQK